MSWWRRFTRRAHSSASSDEDCPSALKRIERHPVLTLPSRPRLSHDELEALDDDDAHDVRWNGVQDARALGPLDALERDIRRLGEARYEPAVPTLVVLWDRCHTQAVSRATGSALLRIGNDHAHDALQAHLDDWDLTHHAFAIESLLDDPRRGYDAFAELAERAAQNEPAARRAIRDALYRFANDPSPARTMMKRLQAEPRWSDLAATLRQGPCGDAARAFLARLPHETVDRLVERHPLPRGPAPRSDLSVLHPYRSAGGDPWAHLVELGPVDGDVRMHALDLAMRKMQIVARNADRIASRLDALDWPLTARAARRAVSHFDAKLHELERMLGVRAPVTLEAFWRVVGGIDWAPTESDELPSWADDIGIERIDPLCVDDLEVAVDCVSEWGPHRHDPRHPAIVGPRVVPIAPDRFHKMHISGGAQYEVAADGSVDPFVQNIPEREPLRFLPYLRNAFRWGGLPGIGLRKKRSARVERVLATLTKDLEPF